MSSNVSAMEVSFVDVGHAVVFMACRNASPQIACVWDVATTLPTCGRLHCSRSCTLVQRNAGGEPANTRYGAIGQAGLPVAEHLSGHLRFAPETEAGRELRAH